MTLLNIPSMMVWYCSFRLPRNPESIEVPEADTCKQRLYGGKGCSHTARQGTAMCGRAHRSFRFRVSDTVSAPTRHYGSVPRFRFPPEAWTANRNVVGGGGGAAGNAGMRHRFPAAHFDDVTELESGGRRRLLMQLEPEA